jgi:hypothetical protein
MKTTFRRCARKISDALVWYHFLPAYSAHGEFWYKTFQSSGAERIGLEFDLLLARMRRSSECLEAASRDLEVVRESMGFLVNPSAPHSVRGVLEEAYRGCLAYLRFRQGALEAADSELEAALEAVRETIRSDEALLTFSLRSLQLITNRARVAKKQRDWTKMNEFLEVCRQIIANHEPLHSCGTSNIYFRDVCSFYQRIEPADAVDAEALEILATPGSLARVYQLAIESVVDSLLIANDF